jgi:NAD(P)-dependent dehydrogenase (short-subunit alcohol dehydrogenase family)
VVIVTGAGSGIGRATCVRLAHAGCRLTLVGRRAVPLEETASQAGATMCLAVPADVSEPRSAGEVVEASRQRWGCVDALVNNAAIAASRPLRDATADWLCSILATNVIGPALLIAAAWPEFARQQRGCVINVSSLATIDPFPGLAAYAASKSALESLTRSVMNDARAEGIAGLRAFSILPGAVETRMLREVVSERDLPRERVLSPDAVAAVIEDCVLGRRDGDVGRVIAVPSP